MPEPKCWNCGSPQVIMRGSDGDYCEGCVSEQARDHIQRLHQDVDRVRWGALAAHALGQLEGYRNA